LLSFHEAPARGLGGAFVGDPLSRIARIPTAVLSDALGRLGTMASAICGGASVQPGDIVHGDEDGVVVFAAQRVREVTSRALEVKRHEADVERRLRRGRPLAEVMRLFDRLSELRKRE
jgi:regulator of RNase E activity RraA